MTPRKPPPPKPPKRVFLRPKMVDAKRGPEVAVLKFQRARGRWVRVPEQGAWVEWEGREKRYWQRRIREGAAEIVDKPKASEAPAEVVAVDKPSKRKPKNEQEQET